MASPPMVTIVEESQVSPPSATIGETSLPLTYFDIIHLNRPPVHFILFYEFPHTKPHFMETIVPTLKHSLSTTLQHFFPFVGNLIIFPTSTKIPEIRYVEGDSVKVTFAECNLDFNDLTSYHPRNCDKFYHLIPRLGECVKSTDYLKIPVFSLQVTLFPHCGISIGITTHHSIADASSHYSFFKAWTLIARCGTDESFLANETLPIYERVANLELEDLFLERAKVIETFFNQEYQPRYLSGPTDKVRASFVLTRSVINQLKKLVLTNCSTSPYVSSFIVSCAYIWCCIAKARNNELHIFGIPVDCRTRLDPPIPTAYFGNCVLACGAIAKTTLLKGNEGLITASKLLGENLHKMLTYKDGLVKYRIQMEDSISEIPTMILGVSGTPRLKYYDLDFGWGKPKKIEKLTIDYGGSISIDAGKDSDQDLEIGVCLTSTDMEAFVRIFNEGLQQYV